MTDSPVPQILVLAADAGETGGIGTAMRDFVRVLVAEYGGDRCHVLSVRAGRPLDDLGAHIIDPGAWIPSQVVPRRRQLVFGLRSLMAAWRYRESLIVVAAHPHLAPVAWASARVARRPFISWVFGKESWLPLPFPIRASLARANSVLAISDFTARHAMEAQNLRPERVHVVHLAVSSRPKPIGCEHRDLRGVLAVARLNREDAYKGVDTLLRVWPAVRAQVAEATLTVVGDGNDLHRFKAEAEVLGVKDSVRFPGPVSDAELDATYASASVFALPCRCRISPSQAEGEGFGLVFIEAAAAGLPVIAGRAGGVTEAVIDGETGFLVPPDDDARIAAAIVTLLKNRDLRDQMGCKGRTFAANSFSREKFRQSVLKEMEEL